MKFADCEKCQTKWVEVKLYNGRLLGISCLCYQEELEKDSGKHIRDLEKLEEYRSLVNSTKNIPPSGF